MDERPIVVLKIDGYDLTKKEYEMDINSVSLGWMQSMCTNPADAHVWLPRGSTTFLNYGLGECLVFDDIETELGEACERTDEYGGGVIVNLESLQRFLEVRAHGWDTKLHLIGVGHDWGCDEKRVRFTDMVTGKVSDDVGTSHYTLSFVDVTHLDAWQLAQLDKLRVSRLVQQHKQLLRMLACRRT